MTEVLVVCGVGGAGKTTTAAALAVAHARAGRRVVVLTIDPARRLADALGLKSLGNTPTPVPLPDGELHALMLDRKATWDELVTRHAPDADTARRLLDNRYYRALSERLSGGHEYMATEKLHALAAERRWDLVVVDTPPSQHALDFLRAPDRIRAILDQGWLQALLKPGGGLTGLATRRVADLVRRLAGDAVIDDLTEFFELVGGIAGGLRDRGAEVAALLRSERTRFVLTTSAMAPQEAEIVSFFPAIRDLGLRAAGILVNRVTEPLPLDPALVDDALTGLPPASAAGLRALADAHRQTAERDATLARRLAAWWQVPVWTVPDLPGGVGDLAALAALSDHLPPRGAPVRGP